MQSVRGVLRQSGSKIVASPGIEPDAIRAGCAEAKQTWSHLLPRYRDAIRAGCAEAKVRRFLVFAHAHAMQSVRGVPKQTEGHCIQTIMRKTMK